MGLLIDGVWHEQWYDTSSTGGRFIRKDSIYRNWVTADGAAGPSGSAGFAAEAGRYHLYVSLACPWAHRTLIMRALKGLEDMVSISVVNWVMREQGWTFADGPGVIPDPVHGALFLREIYTADDQHYTGSVTVPILWDKKTGKIVNNESSEILRMLGSAFDGLGAKPGDYYPQPLRAEIDAINQRIYDRLNNGVYRAGFAQTQSAYEDAFRDVFGALDKIERRLARQRYVAGPRLTEADWRLFPTLVRFDAVYYSHFKCNLRRIVDYPNLSNYLRDLYQQPGIAATVNMDHIKRHYYGSQRNVNPTGIVPLGPQLDFLAPHDRGRFGA